MKATTALLAILILTTASQPVHAESLCGVVRDVLTQSPVEKAGIFVFDAGTYTGLYAATDITGAFCVDPIEPGIYDLQVKVNNYQTMWVEGVVVDASTVSVDIQPTPAVLALALWPNPASSRVHLRYRSPQRSTLSISVHDVQGRLVHGWEGSSRGGETEIRWNLNDISGRTLPPGIYFVRLRSGRDVLTRKLVLTP